MSRPIESMHSGCGKASGAFRRRLVVLGGVPLAAPLILLLVVMLAPGAATVRAGSTAASTPPAIDGAATYKVNCVVCHGEDGKGTETGKSLNTADLHSDEVQKQTNAMLAQVISEGKNNMPPFMSVLSKAEIQSLIVYVRTFAKKAK